jgi:DNA-binding MarR family transcriptional regulator
MRADLRLQHSVLAPKVGVIASERRDLSTASDELASAAVRDRRQLSPCPRPGQGPASVTDVGVEGHLPLLAGGRHQCVRRVAQGSHRFLRWSEDRARDAGLTPALHQLLLVVRGHPDPAGPTIADVADALHMRHHSAVELAQRAQTAGLLDRERDSADHRRVHLTLTAHGR